MDQPPPPPRSERLRRILDEVAELVARGKRPPLSKYYLLFPELEEDLRGHFRRMGLLNDPFRDADEYLREPPPWEAAPPPERARSRDTLPAPAAAPTERQLLLGSLVKPLGEGGRGRRLWRRSRPAILLALAFAAGWVVLVLFDELAAPERLSPSLSGRVEGLAALLILSRDFREARADLLLEGLGETERALDREGERWQLRWLEFLFQEGLGKEAEAARALQALPEAMRARLSAPGEAGPPLARERSRRVSSESDLEALAALGEVLRGRDDRAVARLGALADGDGLLAAMARAAAFPAGRASAARRLLKAQDPRARLLGAAWGSRAGDPSARVALRALPVDGPATARMLVELGEEDLFLKKARPGRIDLAPLRVLVLERRGDRAGARRLAESLLSTAPDSFDLRLSAARLAREEKDAARALDHLRAATLLRPSSPEPMREWLRLAAAVPERPEVLAPCADLFLRRLSAEARALLSRESREGFASPERLLLPAGFGLPEEEGARTRAVASLSRAAFHDPLNAALGFFLARALFAQGLWGEAADRFAGALSAADPLDRQAMRPWLLSSLRHSGRIGEAARLEALARAEEEGREARSAAGRSLAPQVRLPEGPSALLDEEARAHEASGDWEKASGALRGLLDQEPDLPGARPRAAWAYANSGHIASAAAILDEMGSAQKEEGSVEGPILRALLAAAEDDLDLAEEWLGTAVVEEPTDPRPWFLRGYFRRQRGAEAAGDRDWDELLALFTAGAAPLLEGMLEGPGGAPAARGEAAALEPEALFWELSLVHAARGDLGAARWFAALGPGRGSTPPGSFFRAAALAAAGDWQGAEEEALRYRSRRFPLQPWQVRDPWVGPLFEAAKPRERPLAPGEPALSGGAASFKR